MSKYKWDFFIAHAGADNRSAERLYRHLMEQSLNKAKVFLDSEVLLLGDDWNLKLPEAQRQSKITVVLISSKTGAAYYQREEIAAAIEMSRANMDDHRVVPIFLDAKVQQDTVINYGLKSKHSLTITSSMTLGKAAGKLLNLVQHIKQSTKKGNKVEVMTAQKLPEPELSMNISVLNNQIEFFEDSDKWVRYQVERKEDSIYINPDCQYIERHANSGLIEKTRFYWQPFEWDFPTLDIKIVNNSDETIFLNESVFDIEESRCDLFPLLIIKEDTFQSNALQFRIINDGWGMVKNLRVRFHLCPLSEILSGEPEPYAHEIEAGDFLESIDVGISSAISKEGFVNLKGLKDLGRIVQSIDNELPMENEKGRRKKMTTEQLKERRKALCGPYKEGGVTVSGELQFEGVLTNGKEKTHKVLFETVVWLYNENRKGVPRPPSFAYQTKFLVDGKNYKRSVGLSHEIKPKDTDRFTIKIGMDKSSVHNFRLQLLYNEDGVLESKDIFLSAFVSRLGIKYLKENSSQSTN